jgi:hypothetical protein
MSLEMIKEAIAKWRTIGRPKPADRSRLPEALRQWNKN